VVVLNGASSAGKTTLATAFRDLRAVAGEFWLMLGIDDFLAKLPPGWKGAAPGQPAYDAECVRFETTPAGARACFGGVGQHLLRAYHAAVAGAARAGVNVIVDEVVTDKTVWDDWRTVLAGVDVVWVGIRCAADVADERNRSRGDRFPGLARGQTLTVHEHATYDFEIDTTARPPRAALLELTRQLGY